MVNKENKIRILVADDLADVREALATILNKQPDMSVVAEAADGRQAVELFRSYRPDVTLMDLKMPIMDGLQAASAICKEFPDARIIAMTAFGDLEVSRKAEACVRSFFRKDITRQELLQHIRDVYAALY